MNRISLKWIAPVAAALLSTSAIAAPQFLNFPVSTYNPYYPGLISTVLDHEQSYDLTVYPLLIGQAGSSAPYGYTGGILSFTGELFLSNAAYPPAQDACYPKVANTHQTAVWSATLAGVYTGTGTKLGTLPPALCTKNVSLNYDGHPGYDYLINEKTAVYPAYGGSIIFTKCINTFSNNYGCEDYGAIAVDHGNGFVTQYMHMAGVRYGAAANGSNQPVDMTWQLGTVSNKAPTYIGPHLHFEVLQRRATAVDPNNYYSRKNYYVVDPYGYNTASYYGDNLLSKPGCLWAIGCHY